MVDWFEKGYIRGIGPSGNVVEAIAYDEWPIDCAIDPCDLRHPWPKDEDWKERSFVIGNIPIYQAVNRICHVDSRIKKEDFYALLRIMEIFDNGNAKDYIIVCQDSKNPREDGFLSQMRIIRHVALSTVFRAISNTDHRFGTLPMQEVPVRKLLWQFVEQERERWPDQKLMGLFGGDGDWTREVLRISVIREEGWTNVWRIVSDGWLARK